MPKPTRPRARRTPGMPMYLTTTRTPAGTVRHDWRASPSLRKAGWKDQTLPASLPDAIKAAEAINARVDEWRSGGMRPREIKRHIAPATLGQIIRRYEAEAMPKKARSTQKVEATALRRLMTWGGDQPVRAITPRAVLDLKNALIAPEAKGGIGDYPAFNTLKMLRTLFNWAARPDPGILSHDHPNPARAFGLSEPAPRDQIWDAHETAWMIDSAHALELPGMALAIAIAEYTGQREGDLIAIDEHQWREVHGLDRASIDELAGSDGRVMGIHLRQGKTRRWIGVPCDAPMRARVEAALTANRARGAKTGVSTTHLLVNDVSGLPWSERNFIRAFAKIRTHAIARANEANRPDLAERLAELQFRDYRRTCVVRLGELGLEDALISAITGHKLATIKKILEVYMPRTTKMAARAIAARTASGRQTSAQIMPIVGIPTQQSSERKP
jgi:hypothetical protein